jgi:hypothetical protein
MSGDADRAVPDGDTDMNQSSMFARWQCARVESSSRSVATDLAGVRMGCMYVLSGQQITRSAMGHPGASASWH